MRRQIRPSQQKSSETRSKDGNYTRWRWTDPGWNFLTEHADYISNSWFNFQKYKLHHPRYFVSKLLLETNKWILAEPHHLWLLIWTVHTVAFVHRRKRYKMQDLQFLITSKKYPASWHKISWPTRNLRSVTRKLRFLKVNWTESVLKRMLSSAWLAFSRKCTHHRTLLHKKSICQAKNLQQILQRNLCAGLLTNQP